MFSQAQILQLMKTEFARARRHEFPLACLLLQVERIDRLIDVHGGALRDQLRVTLAKLVRERTRGSDALGTVSDDRYLLMLPHTDLTDAKTVAERLLHLFGQLEVSVDGKPLSLHLCIGVAATSDQKTMFFDSLVAQAEAALAFALARGGAGVATFPEAQILGADTGDEPPAEDRP